MNAARALFCAVRREVCAARKASIAGVLAAEAAAESGRMTVIPRSLRRVSTFSSANRQPEQRVQPQYMRASGIRHGGGRFFATTVAFVQGASAARLKEVAARV